MSPPIKNVIVIGGSGNIGRPIVMALLSAGFTVAVLTRNTSTSSTTFPPSVTIHKPEYSSSSLHPAFANQDAVISAIAALSTSEQACIVDAAVAAGVKRFIPSEYGIDTSTSGVEAVIPLTKGKRDTIALLRQKESEGLAWTGIIVGAFFDWSFSIPGLMGWNIPARTATIFDGGDWNMRQRIWGRLRGLWWRC